MTKNALFFAGAIAAALAGAASAQNQKSISAARCTEGQCIHHLTITRNEKGECRWVFRPEVLLIREGVKVIRWQIKPDDSKWEFDGKAVEFKPNALNKDLIGKQYPGGKLVGPKIWDEPTKYTTPGAAFYYKVRVKDDKGACAYDPPIINDMGVPPDPGAGQGQASP